MHEQLLSTWGEISLWHSRADIHLWGVHISSPFKALPNEPASIVENPLIWSNFSAPNAMQLYIPRLRNGKMQNHKKGPIKKIRCIFDHLTIIGLPAYNNLLGLKLQVAAQNSISAYFEQWMLLFLLFTGRYNVSNVQRMSAIYFTMGLLWIKINCTAKLN